MVQKPKQTTLRRICTGTLKIKQILFIFFYLVKVTYITDGEMTK